MGEKGGKKRRELKEKAFIKEEEGEVVEGVYTKWVDVGGCANRK